MECLRAELTRHFGRARRYKSFWSWLLDRRLGIELQVNVQCPDGSSCEVWGADPLWPQGPRLFMAVKSPEDVEEAVRQVHKYVAARTRYQRR